MIFTMTLPLANGAQPIPRPDDVAVLAARDHVSRLRLELTHNL